jgi:type IV secretory pathway VirB2 component (pilin)
MCSLHPAAFSSSSANGVTMLGNLGSILNQIATALTSGTVPTAIATIAIAVVGVLWAMGRISFMLMAGTVIGIIIVGSAATIAPQLL